MSNSPQFITGLVLIGLVIWPVIVNSQIGNEFIAAGINWKADDLDGTLFWSGIALIILNGTVVGYNQNKKEKVIYDKR